MSYDTFYSYGVFFTLYMFSSNSLTLQFSAQYTKQKLALLVMHMHAQIHRYTHKTLQQHTSLIFFPFLDHTYFIKLHAVSSDLW